MKCTLTASLLAVLLGLPFGANLALAQDDAPPASTADEATVSDEAQEKFDALKDEASTAYEEWVTDLRARMAEAEERGEKLPESDFVSPLGAFVEKFQKGATEFAGTESAVPFLLWLVTENREDQEATKAALETIVASHIESPNLKPLKGIIPYLSYVVGEERAKELLPIFEKKSVVPSIRAWAAFGRLQPVLESAAIDSEEFIAAKREILAVLETAKDRGLKSQVMGKLDVREKFSLGMVAPDIAGIDLDGVEFKLSDYRGNVLFVDFWGDW